MKNLLIGFMVLASISTFAKSEVIVKEIHYTQIVDGIKQSNLENVPRLIKQDFHDEANCAEWVKSSEEALRTNGKAILLSMCRIYRVKDVKKDIIMQEIDSALIFFQ